MFRHTIETLQRFLDSKSGCGARKSRASLRRKPTLDRLEDRRLFAIDSLAVVHANTVLVDTNRDPAAEIDMAYGLPGDVYFSGNWTGAANGGIEYPGVVRKGNPDGLLHWFLDSNGDRNADIERAYGLPTDKPVAGDWNGDGKMDLGVVREGSPDGLLHWILDTNGDQFGDLDLAYGWHGDVPVTGDWNGDGKTDIGVVRGGNADGLLHWLLDTNRDPFADIDLGYGLKDDKPIVGDWDGNGVDDVGVVRDKQADGLLHWLIDTDRDKWANAEIRYGLPGDVPLTGNFRLPEISIDGVASGQSARMADSTFEQAGSTQTFVIRNVGTAWLGLGSPEVPAGFQLVKAPVTALAPGMSDTLVVKVDTSTPGDHSGTLRLVNNDGNESPFDIGLSAKVLAANVEVDGATNGGALYMGYQLRGMTPETRSIVIRNTGNSEAHLSSVTVGGDFRLVQAPAATLAPGATTVVTVSFPNDAVRGVVGELAFQSNDPLDRTYRVRLDGAVVEPLVRVGLGLQLPNGDYQAIPNLARNATDFGLVSVGDVGAIRTFKVSNTGNLPLILGQPNMPAGFRLVDGLVTPLAPGKSDAFAVELETRDPGARTGSITFTTNDPTAPEFSFAVTGRVGVPDITVGAMSLDFGRLNERGIESVRFLPIKNDGDGPLRFNVSSLPKGYTVLGGDSPFEVAPGQTASLRISLSTSVAGWRNGDLVLKTNDADEGVRIVRLTGVVTPFFVTSINHPLRDATTTEFRVTNQTDAPQTFELIYKANEVVFTQGLPPTTIPAGATVSYVFKLSKATNLELLRFRTSDPSRPIVTVVNSGSWLIGFHYA